MNVLDMRIDTSLNYCDFNQVESYNGAFQVIEGKGSYSVTLQLEPHQSQSCLSGLTDLIKFDMGVGRGKKQLQSKTWRFKWLSEATFYNFVSLLKAIHEEMATSALSIKCVS